MSTVGGGSLDADTGPIPTVEPSPAQVSSPPSLQPPAAQAGPTQTGSTQPDSTQPGSTQPGSTQPGSTQPGSTQTGSTQTPAVVRSPAEEEARWRRIRRQAGAGYLLLVILVVLVIGIPTDRGSLTLLVLAGLGIPCLGRGWAAFRRVLLDWLPFTAALVVYDYSRGLADLAGQPLHVADVAKIDHDVFGVIPTVWLQEHYLSPGAVHWYDAAATLVYVTHFLATPVMAAVLWLRNRELWLAFVRRVLVLAVAGLATYVLYPAAPPWYASRVGAIGPVVRASGRGWLWLHINHAGNLLQEGQAASNPVAAMPSLHTGYATLIALFVLSTVGSRFAWLMLLYPAAMAVSLVYLGEHYVIDVVAGILYALVIHTAINWWEGWSAERRRKRVADAPPGSGLDESAGLIHHRDGSHRRATP